MSAQVNLPPTYNLVGIAKAAGSQGAYRYEEPIFIVSDVTQSALDSAVASYNDAAYQAQLTAQNTALSKIAVGCQIVSIATPALNGTYGLDLETRSNIAAIQTSINANKGFPNNETSVNIKDTNDNNHTFTTTTDFTNFAAAIRDYFYNIIMGQPTTQPMTIP